MSQATLDTSDPIAYTRTVLHYAHQLAQEAKRADLSERIEGAYQALAQRLDTMALVVGLNDAGKTSFVNECAQADILPVDVLHATPVNVAVGPGSRGMVVFREVGDQVRQEQAVNPSDLRDLLVRSPGELTDISLVQVDVATDWPRPQNLTLVDTPSWSLASAVSRSRLVGFAPDLLVLVSDAGQELSQPELAVLAAADRRGMQSVLVLTKIDMHVHWRRIMEIDVAHLARAGLKVPVLPVSLRVAQHARRQLDERLLAESGMPAVLQMLDRSATGQRMMRSCDRALDVVEDTSAELARSLNDQLDLISNPERASALTAQRADAQARAMRVQSASAKWPEKLNEGLERQSFQSEHQLRTGLQKVMSTSMEELETADPADMWPIFASQLQHDVEIEIARAFDALQDGLSEVVTEVGKLFGEEGGIPSVDLGLGGRARLTDQVEIATKLDEVAGDRAGNVVNALRGSAASLSITGLLTHFGGAALAFANPILLPVGAAMTLLLGHRAYKASKGAELQQRRRAAAASVKKYLDEIVPEAMMQFRSELMTVRRNLPEHFRQVAMARLQAVEAEMRAANVGEAERDSTSKVIQQQLAVLANVAGHGQAARAVLAQRMAT